MLGKLASLQMLFMGQHDGICGDRYEAIARLRHRELIGRITTVRSSAQKSDTVQGVKRSSRLQVVRSEPLQSIWLDLPLLQRQILELVLVESNSYSDAAYILGLTTDEVVTHLALARYALMSASGSLAA